MMKKCIWSFACYYTDREKKQRALGGGGGGEGLSECHLGHCSPATLTALGANTVPRSENHDQTLGIQADEFAVYHISLML